jgi:hypothetical protein
MSVTVNGTSGLVFGDGTIQGTAAGMPFRNRIINGDMRIDQRNNGAVFTSTASAPYTVDRWQSNCPAGATFTAQRVEDAPAGSGLLNSLKITVTSSKASVLATDEYMVRQSIEGYNVADFELGVATAKTFTVSFWVKSSVTGTHSGAFRNALANRGYAFTYTITSANTWEYKTITVPGDTTGTWNKTDIVGIRLQFDLGCGDNMRVAAGSWVDGVSVVGATGAVRLITNSNATWQITGVQVEKAEAATAFEFRPYGIELAICQRYFQTMGRIYYSGSYDATTTLKQCSFPYPVPMRAAPTFTAGALFYGNGASTSTLVANNPTSTTFWDLRNIDVASGVMGLEAPTFSAEL